VTRIEVPPKLAEYHARFYGAGGRSWTAGLPDLATQFLGQWQLRLDGPSKHGMVALVLPVRRVDGTPAALKLQPIDPEHLGEPEALAAWAGDGAVRLLEHDAGTGTMLLERLDSERDLLSVPDDLAAVQVIAELLARLHRHDAPPGVPQLRDVANRMIAAAPVAAAGLADPDEAALIRRWADRLAEVVDEPANRLLHWDLHYENVLAATREPWLAIDPKPLAGHPGFDLLPALHDRWDEVMAANDPKALIRRRFDLMVEVLGLDRERAVVWSLGRTLQNSIWDVEDGSHRLAATQTMIAGVLAE
jgi:streptomycin 6-kinase